MKKQLFIPALCCLALFLSCTKDRNPDFIQEQWDFSGMWNAYGYTDLSGWVPIEVIEIVKTGYQEYSAYKRGGDNAVRSGVRTWVGTFNTNPVKIMMTVSNGVDQHEVELELVVKSANRLAIEKYDQITYVRRTE